MWPYADEQAAIKDVMRLARGMTYKTAAAGLNFGGGKSVIIGDPGRDKTETLMRAMGRMVDQLGGDYVAGFDIGTTLDDMELLALETEHVMTLPEHAGGAGDVSAATALGVVQAIRASANRVWGTPDLNGWAAHAHDPHRGARELPGPSGSGAAAPSAAGSSRLTARISASSAPSASRRTATS
jgi:glutamate dehydrogenase/leucine dehydrogenase